MSIEFTCPECGKLLRTRDERAGARAVCPECNREITVPGPDLSETAAYSSLMGSGGAVGSAAVASRPMVSNLVDSGSANGYCSACGVTRSEGEVYCTGCGEPFVVDGTRVSPAKLVYAGFWLRAAAWLLDVMIVGAAMGMVSRITFSWVEEAMPLAWWLYYALLESSEYQGTVGKIVLGMIVTDESGRPITFGRATGRFFAKILSIITLFVGFAMAGMTQRKQALHDLLSGCLVLRKV